MIWDEEDLIQLQKEREEKEEKERQEKKAEKKCQQIKRLKMICYPFIFAGLIYFGYEMFQLFFPLSPPIKAPTLEQAEYVEIVQDGTIIYDLEEKQKIIYAFLSAKSTRQLPINDIPMALYHYVILMNYDGKEVVSYIYIHEDRWYIEQPYYGIYKIQLEDVEAFDMEEWRLEQLELKEAMEAEANKKKKKWYQK